MSDQVDDLLRRAMATLDRQVPSGYFDTLADRVAARLDAPAGVARAVDATAVDAPKVDAPEIAARAVDAPAVDELARQRARRAAVLPPLPAAPAELPAEPARKATWGRHLAVAAGFGFSVAAAVGVMIFITYEQRDRKVADAPLASAPAAERDDAPARAGNAAQPGAAGAGSPASAPTPPIPVERSGANDANDGNDATDTIDAIDAIDAKVSTNAGKRPATTAGTSRPRAGKSAPEPAKGKPRGKLGKLESDPELPQTNAKGVAISLSKDDFQRGMAEVAPQARSCFAGTRGTAALQVTVVPTGKVARTVVSGDFAGTPVAACLQRAVASATFPPWAGKPQRYAHSYVLSESR